MKNYYGTTWADDVRPSDYLPSGVVNSFLQRVYLLMAIGLGVTGLTAYGFYSAISTSTGSLNPEYQFLFTGAMPWLLMLAPVVLVFTLSLAINKISPQVAGVLFFLYAFVNGISLSPIFLVYTTSSIASTFFITGATFGVMAIIGITTKMDLTKFGTYLTFALIGLVIAGLVNIFLKNTMMDFIISESGVLIFCGLTAFDTQKIMRAGLSMDVKSDEAQKGAIIGALTLYLDFINLFLYLLRFLGTSRDE
ncbi:MAG: Bax inhibitor-1/YccA family protein [Bacteroidia bacterium]|nr:Bax inhibitor-1/YccA family protein [Bacteroidia bacterium]